MDLLQDSNEHDVKEQHQQLAAVIKGVHKQLRRAYRENDGNHDLVWERHAQDRASLQHYAQAMHLLATQHWTAHPDTRIQWCRRTALEYFTGGGMQRSLEKDARRRMDCKIIDAKKNELSHQEIAGSIEQVLDTSSGATNDHNKNVDVMMKNIRINMQPSEGHLHLLDVGSCYNPFLECPEFETLGIDLSPATESVYQCDFLKLKLTASLALASTTSSSSTSTSALEPELWTSAVGLSSGPQSGSVTHLPRGSFHVVVFSLLLEYLPAPVQRWSCCVKAHELLVSHGLLLIITPDSNSANRNAPMMKSWRQALEHIGFQRWRYHKMEHVHCMAFRKVNEIAAEEIPEYVQKLLYIPQDFNDACYDDDHLPASLKVKLEYSKDNGNSNVSHKDLKREAELENFILSCNEELPLLISEDEES